MKIGVVFPQTEIGADVDAVRRYAQQVEALGFTHVLAYDHVVGADPARHRGWAGPYDVSTTFHEPFVLFGYLAAVTPIELVTGIIILPQRQTALVATAPGQVRRRLSSRLPARRSARRRLVPPGASRPRPRGGSSHRRRGGT